MPGMIIDCFAKVFLSAISAILSVDNSPILPLAPKLIMRRDTEKLVMIGPGYNTLTDSPDEESSWRNPNEKEDINAFDAG